MYSNYYVTSSSNANEVWIIISLILAIIGGILAYVLFVKKDNKLPNKFLEWLKKFLDFKEMIVEPLLKVTYIILAIFITLSSFSLISESFVEFLLSLVVGNLVLRLIYEFSLVLIQIWKNTTQINDKMKK